MKYSSAKYKLTDVKKWLMWENLKIRGRARGGIKFQNQEINSKLFGGEAEGWFA